MARELGFHCPDDLRCEILKIVLELELVLDRCEFGSRTKGPLFGLSVSMLASGVWQNRSEARLNDYQQDEQMVGKYIDVLYQSMISNRGLDAQKAQI